VFILFFAGIGNLAGADDLSIGIRLVEQKIYFLNDDIAVKVTVKNDSTDTRQFRIADNRVFSLDFDVRTAINRPVDYHSEAFKNSRNSLKPVFYRDLSVSPGEEYSLVLKLNDYIALREPGLYVVQVKFYPNLYISESSASIDSNKLTLNIRPAAENDTQRATIEAQLDRDAMREDLTPDKVVAYTIKARYTAEWSKFFLYINIESLYINSTLRNDMNGRDRFNRLSEADKKARLDMYRNQMMIGKSEGDLVLLASEFTILKTTYTPTDANVQVLQIYNHPDYKESRTYLYTLRLSGKTWEITDYQVTNRNTGTH
jgi:hypothetical protein